MRLLFTRSNSLMSRVIRAVTKEPVSHCVIETDGFIIHSNLLGVHAEPIADFTSEAVYSVCLKPDFEKLLGVFAGMNGSPYDFGALFYMGLRLIFPWLPKKNLWQCSGMFLCTEFVTEYLDGVEDSEITPYQLYLRMENASA